MCAFALAPGSFLREGGCLAQRFVLWEGGVNEESRVFSAVVAFVQAWESDCVIVGAAVAGATAAMSGKKEK